VPYRDELESHWQLALVPTRRASPCDARWDDDTVGSAGARWCGPCGRTVYDATRLSGPERRALLTDGRGCHSRARLLRRADGRLLLTDCPVGAQRRRRRRVGYALL